MSPCLSPSEKLQRVAARLLELGISALAGHQGGQRFDQDAWPLAKGAKGAKALTLLVRPGLVMPCTHTVWLGVS